MADTIPSFLAGPAGDALLLVARVLMALMFVGSAIDKFKLDQAEVAMIRSLHLPAPEGLERLVGVCELLGVAMLVLGAGARLGAAALAAFVLFTTLMFLRFWSFQGPREAAIGMRNTFFGNLAVTGGLIHVAVFGPGGFALLPGW